MGWSITGDALSVEEIKRLDLPPGLTAAARHQAESAIAAAVAIAEQLGGSVLVEDIDGGVRFTLALAGHERVHNPIPTVEGQVGPATSVNVEACPKPAKPEEDQ